MMIKLKLDITADEMELLRYLVFKGTEFTSFDARTFILWLNNRRNFGIKELLKLNLASRGSIYTGNYLPEYIEVSS